MDDRRGDFERFCLSDGIDLHLHHTKKFKTVRIDIFIQELLQEKRNTRIALVSRLLERGTRRLPDTRSLNRFIDGLYGASFEVAVDQLGYRQLIHLYFAAVDERYLVGVREPLLRRGMDFLYQVLREPACEGRGFRRDYLRQEKNSLRRNIRTLFNDKSLYAQRRCVEEMCCGEPYGLSFLGDPRDFRGIRTPNLLKFYFGLLALNPVDVFVSGHLEKGGLIRFWEDFFNWEREPRPVVSPAAKRSGPSTQPRRIFEAQDVHQGRLRLGYRTGTSILDLDYPALVLFNALWGGDSNSRLFRHVREEAGLCYYIATHLEPLCGLLFVAAGLDPEDYEAVLLGVDVQLEAIREKRFDAGELERVRSLLVSRLQSLDDNRDGLVRFYYRQRVADLKGGRRRFQTQLAAVTPDEVSQVARKLELDTTFFLHGGEVGRRGA